MTRLLTILICCLTAMLAGPLRASAQGEADFAERFLRLYADDYRLESTTVSPAMMQRMMQLPDVESNEQARKALSQMKSIRMVRSSSSADAPHLFANARQLAEHNAQRFKRYAEDKGKCLYTRRRGKLIVELILFMQTDGGFVLIDLTGNMTERFVGSLLPA